MPTFVPKEGDTYITDAGQTIRINTLTAIESTKTFVDNYDCTFSVVSTGEGTFIVRQSPDSEPTVSLVESGVEPRIELALKQVSKTGGRRKTRHRRRKPARSRSKKI